MDLTQYYVVASADPDQPVQDVLLGCRLCGLETWEKVNAYTLSELLRAASLHHLTHAPALV